MDEALGKGIVKDPVVLGDDISEMSVDSDSVGADKAPFIMGRGDTLCAGMCGPRMESIESSIGHIKAMLGMLMGVSGLAGPEDTLAAEKRKGRMARECDVSVASAAERAKAEELVKVAGRRAHRKADEDERAEEARVQQEERVKVKEAARMAALAERDRVVEVVKGTEGQALVDVVERVVDRARMVEILEREVADSAAPVENEHRPIVWVKKKKTVQVVSQLSRRLNGERRKTM